MAVDEAALEVLNARGCGKAFKHAAGTVSGTRQSITNALPRIHPLSDEILESGMVFDIEPAVCIPGLGGMRQRSMVALTDGGAELLTDFVNEART